MADVYKAKEELLIYKDCSKGSAVIGKVAGESEFEVSENVNGWYHLNKGWICAFDGSKVLIEKTGSTTQTNIS